MKWISSILIGMLFAYAGTAWGQSCSVTATPAGFGNYDTTAPAPLDTISEIGVNCDPGIPYQIKLDEGQNSSGTFARKMRSSAGSSTLEYNLYRDSARTEVWGDGTGNSFIRAGIGTGALEQFTVSARVPSRQNVSAGMYSDSIIVIVEW